MVAAAFGRQAEADLVEAIRASPHYIAKTALVAEGQDQIVGHVMISGTTLHNAAATRQIAILAPLAVDPAWQRRGIGGALMVAACRAAERCGQPLVVLEGSPEYYSRFGFEPSYRHDIELPLPGWAPREAGQVLRLAGYEPTLTGRVVYPESFPPLSDAGP